ncbi:MAG: hypothetical protein EBE86_026645 [Hormoscilla sp. GUM202]|nr:hypothetical protein [Hormoscilla sp. GUM202]
MSAAPLTARIGINEQIVRQTRSNLGKLPKERAYHPVAGCIERCKSGSEREGWEAIPSSTPTYFYDTMIHEFGHVLGFFGGSDQTTGLRGASSTRGSSGSRSTRGTRSTRSSQRVVSLPSLTDRNLVTEDETNPVYNADTFAGIAYGELLETFEPTALELTRGASSGSDLSHWRENVFGNEMMTDSGSAGINELLGSITIGAMRDLGFNVNYGAAEPYRLEM